MREKTWKVLEYGQVPPDSMRALYTCLHCGHEAHIPVVGRPIAQVGMGIVFDAPPYEMPTRIQCRKCRRIYETRSTKPDAIWSEEASI